MLSPRFSGTSDPRVKMVPLRSMSLPISILPLNGLVSLSYVCSVGETSRTM